MAVSRPLLIALVAAVLLVATVGAMRVTGGEKNDGADKATAPAAAQPASKPEAKPSAAPVPKPAAREGLPRRVANAIGRGRPVVLFLYQPGAADDHATARAVSSVRGSAAVFTAPIRRAGDYRVLVDGLGIDQAPAVVVAGRSRKAKVLRGYVDAGTLRQEVADAR